MIKSRHLLAALILFWGCSGSSYTASDTTDEVSVEPAPIEMPVADEKSADRISLDPKILSGTLDNGLSYMIRANDTPENRAELRLVVNAGSILEDDDQLGLAHFVEHMAFNGTANFEKQALVEYLESIGMRFGADINAYTSFDETVYKLQLPSDSTELLDKGFEILRDWAGNLSFDPEEIEKERGVVIEEWRLRRGGMARIMDRQYPVLLHGSRYPDRLPIGTLESLEGFDPERLVQYYRDWYRPSLMTLIAVGDFDASAIRAQIESLFSDLTDPESPRERVLYELPDHEETLYSIESDPEALFASVGITYKHARGDEGSHEEYVESMRRSLFSSMMNQRLGELTQEADPPFIGAGGGDGALVRTKGSFRLSAGAKDGQYLRALRVILEEAERIRRFGFTKTEFDRAQTTRLRRMEVAYNERDNERSGTLASEYIRHTLAGESVPGIVAEFKLVQEILPTISLDQVNSLVPILMTTTNQVISISGQGTDEQPMPTISEVKAIFNAIASTELEPYEDETLDAPLLATIPEPGSIVEESHTEDIEMTQWTLSNGVKVVLRPTEFKADEVLLSATSPGGASLSADDQYLSAQFSTSIVSASGVGEFNAIALSKKLTGKIVRLRPFVGSLEEGFSGSASPQDLETLFQLTYLYATAPRADSTVFASYIGRMNSMLSAMQASPQSAFGDTMTVTLNQYHHRTRPFSEEILSEVKLNDGFEFFKDRFADFSDFTFYLVGAFDLEMIRPLVETYLATLPSTHRVETFRDVGIRTPPGVIEKSVFKGVEPKSRVQIVFSGETEWSMEERRRMRMLQRVLDTRLREILREDMGGTYGVSVRGSLREDPYENFQFTISFGCAPDRVDELVASVWADIELLQSEPPDEDHMANAREASFRSWEVGLEENSYWLSTLQFYISRDMDPTRILINPADALEEVSGEDIMRAAQKYLNRDRYVRVTLYPEDTDS